MTKHGEKRYDIRQIVWGEAPRAAPSVKGNVRDNTSCTYLSSVYQSWFARLCLGECLARYQSGSICTRESSWICGDDDQCRYRSLELT